MLNRNPTSICPENQLWQKEGRGFFSESRVQVSKFHVQAKKWQSTASKLWRLQREHEMSTFLLVVIEEKSFE